MASFNIRKATPKDCQDLMRMIKELAAYLNKADEVVITVNDVEKYLFGEKRLAEALVAELSAEEICQRIEGERTQKEECRFDKGDCGIEKSIETEPVSHFASGSGHAGRPLVGYALYFYNFHTWYGPYCFIMDFYVTEEWRRNGIGSVLWAKIIQEALSMRCSNVTWEVYDWNKRSMDYYKRKGACDLTEQDGKHVLLMDRKDMEKCVAETLASATGSDVSS
ncbi:diamine acetyltransferase 1-like [Babylonia areolata]|uniref:diamine acetyltransferase 1-like n=1 Tax=Babylonia areolata TaxID=304850 RepID=UPI003FD0AF09